MDKKEAFDIFEKVIEVKLVQAVTEEETAWIKRKDIHSRDVLKFGKEILEKDDKLSSIKDNFYKEALASLLLHDLGRFYQFKNGEFDFSMKHGELGAQILKEEFGVTSPHILLALKYHDVFDFEGSILNDDEYIKLSDKEKQEVMLIGQLVKDADKLENFIQYKRNNEFDFFDFGQRLHIKSEALESFLNGKLIEWAIYKKEEATAFDSGVSTIAWMNEVFFRTTKDIIEENGIKEFLIDLMREKSKKIYEASESDMDSEYKLLLIQIDQIEEYLKSL